MTSIHSRSRASVPLLVEASRFDLLLKPVLVLYPKPYSHSFATSVPGKSIFNRHNSLPNPTLELLFKKPSFCNIQSLTYGLLQVNSGRRPITCFGI